jgi:uncharacterized membrane protein YfcA
MSRGAGATDTAGPRRTLGRLERLPLRRIVRTTLAIVLVVVIGGAIYKTLTLPAAEHLDWSFWANLAVIGIALGAV